MPMPRDADATRARLLVAARDEFAAVGIAGARVDRIAAAAASNKAQIYHYFGSKDGLFDAVFDAMVAETLDEVTIDADDLPEYAGRLHDSYAHRPWVQRLATWYRLERGDTSHPIDAVVQSNAAKLRAIEDAQRDGRLPTTFSAAELLGIVIHTAALWSGATPEYARLTDAVAAARRREVVVATVAAVVRG
ncbi:TetR family transcriptional regulator [Curtobacterium sp. SORGH_AS_0776]|uniref:TetR family transcriptional regulator n=1 Tax=Curtobacterium sp. SORGH_AS_0776 TaxID=3041798 RepID=UPI0028672994|nr:TetR family transcriptional regulator [Curtobacterium sp. SORGH_AS_0776]MDR6170551.1 AcrR family transcriptional regulator [Curtobacterium sp. SORGH_AS_0776]